MSSKVLLVSLILAIELFNANASMRPATLFLQQRAEQALQEQILKAKSDIVECHFKYSQVLKDILENFNLAVKECEDTEKQLLLDLSSEGEESRETITKSLDNVCVNLRKCKEETENLNFFDCIDNSGDSNTRHLWKASRDSSEIAALIREQTHAIKFETEKCNSAAEREYIVAQTKATDEMINCYANGGPSPTPSSSETD